MHEDTQRWLAQDKSHAWHPFTQQRDWCAPAHEPLVITRAEGIYLYDSEGRRYIDGNSSIWTNIHGHNHPTIHGAIRAQLDTGAAHTSYLGLANPRASELAEALISLVPETSLERVFFSDDGSTALECAFKMSLQYRHLTSGEMRDHFVVFENAYHGDTLGAASLGGVDRFASAARKVGFKSHVIPSLEDLATIDPDTVTAVVIEPLIQGVNEMRLWPSGMLRELRRWCDEHEVHLILDEVMTGFGRTGKMFAHQHEDVAPDFLCLAKGLTSGVSPLAATLTTGQIYDAFLGGPEKTFYYGHSFTGHQLGCAAALANIELFEREGTLTNVAARSQELREHLAQLAAKHKRISSIRSLGLIGAISLDGPAGTGARICDAARAHGLITRPILNTIAIMPPLCIAQDALTAIFTALDQALNP